MRLSTLASGLRWAFGGAFIVKLITSIGFSAVAYVGIGALLSQIKDQLIDTITGLPLEVIHLMGFYNVDIALNLVFSAYATVAAVALFKRFAWGRGT